MRTHLKLAAMAMTLSLMAACSSSPAPRSEAKADTLHQETTTVLSQFNRRDPTLQRFLDNSYGYVVFPNVAAGAIGVGGAYGRGEVYKGNQLIGYADLSQANLGVQLGGENYSEIVCFQNQAALDEFREGAMRFDARASAAAEASGGAAAADYQRGVAVFSMTQSGLMFQAAIGGQSFRYDPDTSMASDRE